MTQNLMLSTTSHLIILAEIESDRFCFGRGWFGKFGGHGVELGFPPQHQRAGGCNLPTNKIFFLILPRTLLRPGHLRRSPTSYLPFVLDCANLTL